MKAFSEMTGPELINAYNELAAKTGKLKVARFATRTAGVKRCEALAAAVLAGGPISASGEEPGEEINTEAVNDSTNQEEGVVTTKTKRKAKKIATPKAKKTAPKIAASNGKLSNRQKLKNALTDPLGKKHTRAALCKAVYGSANADNYGPLNMVLRGLKLETEGKSYPYKLTRSKNDEGEICYTLNNA